MFKFKKDPIGPQFDNLCNKAKSLLHQGLQSNVLGCSKAFNGD